MQPAGQSEGHRSSRSGAEHLEGVAAADPAGWLAASYGVVYCSLTARFCRGGLHPADAQDLAQETILRTLLHVSRRGSSGGDLSPLVQRIARNLYVQRARSRLPRVVPLSEHDELPDPSPHPEEAFVAAEQRRAVRAAVARLHPRHRLVIGLWLSGATPSQIAAVLRLNRNAADALLHRARRSLAAALGEERP